MSFCRFLWDNTAFDNAAISASSAASGLPASYMQDHLRGNVTQTDGVTTAYWDVDFGEEVWCNSAAFINNNFSTTGVITITAGTSAGDSDLLDASFDAVVAYVGFGESGFGYDSGFGGFLTDEQISRYSTDPCREVHFDGVGARYWRFTVADPENSDGYLQIGRVFLCEAVNAPMPAKPLDFKPQSLSATIKTKGGQKHTDLGSKFRSLNLVWPSIEPEHVWWTFVEMFWDVCADKDFVVSLSFDEDDSQDLWLGTIYGRLLTEGQMSLDNVLNGNSAMRIEESL